MTYLCINNKYNILTKKTMFIYAIQFGNKIYELISRILFLYVNYMLTYIKYTLIM